MSIQRLDGRAWAWFSSFCLSLSWLVANADSSHGWIGQDNPEPLVLSVQPERDRIQCYESLEVLVILENRSKDAAVEDIDRGVELQISKDGGSWQEYLPPRLQIHPKVPIKLVRPAGDREMWGIDISTNDSKGIGSKIHPFSQAGKYSIRALSNNNLLSSPVEIVVAEPTDRSGKQAMDLVKGSGVSRWFSWEAPTLREIPDEELAALAQLRSHFLGSVLADHATWALAIDQWRGVGARDESKALALAKELAAKEGSPIRIRGYMLLSWMVKDEDPKAAARFREQALLLNPGPANRYFLEEEKRLLSGKSSGRDSARTPSPSASRLTENRDPLEWAGCVLEPEDGPGDSWVLYVHTVKELPSPWLPLRFALAVGNAGDTDANLAPDLYAQLETRKKGAADWRRFALKPPRKGLIHWRDEERVFRANERKLWEATLHLQHGGTHAFEEPGDYEIRLVLGDLRSKEVPIKVNGTSESDRLTLTRIREEALLECLGYGGYAHPSIRNGLSALIRDTPSSVYAPHLQLGLVWNYYVSSFDKVGADPIAPEIRQALDILQKLSQRDDSIGAEACAIMGIAFTKHTDRETRARLLEQALKKNPDPGLAVRIHWSLPKAKKE